jgi:hypothetical protein
VAIVPLHGKLAAGRVALVEDEDLELVADYRWNVWEYDGGGPYDIATPSDKGGLRRTTVHMHKVITGWPQTDHIDGNGLNNQRSNLRSATTQQNTMNQRSRVGSSIYTRLPSVTLPA